MYAFFILVFVIIFVYALLFVCIRTTNFTANIQQKTKPSYAVITVKNCEDYIEGLVHLTICQLNSLEGYIDNIIILDLGSCDDTAVIAKKLCQKYPSVIYKTRQEYIEYISTM